MAYKIAIWHLNLNKNRIAIIYKQYFKDSAQKLSKI